MGWEFARVPWEVGGVDRTCHVKSRTSRRFRWCPCSEPTPRTPGEGSLANHPRPPRSDEERVTSCHLHHSSSGRWTQLGFHPTPHALWRGLATSRHTTKAVEKTHREERSRISHGLATLCNKYNIHSIYFGMFYWCMGRHREIHTQREREREYLRNWNKDANSELQAQNRTGPSWLKRCHIFSLLYLKAKSTHHDRGP